MGEQGFEAAVREGRVALLEERNEEERRCLRCERVAEKGKGRRCRIERPGGQESYAFLCPRCVRWVQQQPEPETTRLPLDEPEPPKAEPPLRVVELRVENVKRIRAARVRPESAGAVVVGGRNFQGKTSLLDGIAYAIGGKRLIPEEPLRRGAARGEASVDLGRFRVERRFSKSGSTLRVIARDGAEMRSPQRLLDELLSPLTFDPLGFLAMSPADQLATVRRLAGVETADLERARADAYEQRRDVNRALRDLEGELREAPDPGPGREQEVPIADLAARQRSIADEVAANERQRGAARRAAETHEAARRLVVEADRKVARLREELADAESALEQQEAREEEARRAREQTQAAADTLVDPDGSKIERAIASAEAINRAVRQRLALRRLRDAIDARRREADILTEAIAAADHDRAARIAAASLPVDGLAFDAERVTFQDLPLDQASGAEQLRVSCAIGMALHPELRVMLIRDGARLDLQQLALLDEFAAAADYQLWVERVGDGEEVTVLIEDGEVVRVEGKA